MQLLQDLSLPDPVDDGPLGLGPAAEVLDQEGVGDLAKGLVPLVPALVDAAEAVLDEEALRPLAPQELQEGIDHLAFAFLDVTLDLDHRVFAEDGAPRVDDLGLQLAPRLVPQ